MAVHNGERLVIEPDSSSDRNVTILVDELDSTGDHSDDCMVISVALKNLTSTSCDADLIASNVSDTISNMLTLMESEVSQVTVPEEVPSLSSLTDDDIIYVDDTDDIIYVDDTEDIIYVDDTEDIIYVNALPKTNMGLAGRSHFNSACKSMNSEQPSLDFSTEGNTINNNNLTSASGSVQTIFQPTSGATPAAGLQHQQAFVQCDSEDEPLIVSEIIRQPPRHTQPVPPFDGNFVNGFTEPMQMVQPHSHPDMQFQGRFPSGETSGNTFSNTGFRSDLLPFQTRLRPIAIDGSNVAFAHGCNQLYSCRGIQLCIDHFLRRGHTTVKAFVPQFRRQHDPKIIDRHLLEKLGDCQLVVFTPSRTIFGQNIVCHDDRFILEYAERTGAVIVSNDNFREFQSVSPSWGNMILSRLLMFTFADDIFMVPSDPLGRHGPSLNQILSF